MDHDTIALDVAFKGVKPTIDGVRQQDWPLNARITITLGTDVPYAMPGGGQMSLSAGSSVTGTIIGKQALGPKDAQKQAAPAKPAAKEVDEVAPAKPAPAGDDPQA